MADMNATMSKLEQEYDRLAGTLAKPGYVVQGSVFERRKGPGSRYQWSWKNRDQKTESLTLSLEQYQWLRAAVANHRRIERTLAKMRRLSARILKAKLPNPERRK